jgi:tRNA(Arg) A34 adenosine deaminase TadA
MCSAAHGWVGLGRIVYAHSSAQLAEWLDEMGVPRPPVRIIPIEDVIAGVEAQGPIGEFEAKVRELHRRFHRRT